MYLKLLDKIKSVFKNDNKVETEKLILAQKSCLHCASRGMFVFDDNSKNPTAINKVKFKDQCQSELVED